MAVSKVTSEKFFEKRSNTYLVYMGKDTKNKKKGHNQVTFKPYQQNQMWLFPPSLGELIPSDHYVRLVNEAIEAMDLDPLLNTYEGGGSSAYHPRMMLKALVYGYIEKIYSSRGIEKAIRENICFMWLCGMQQPDHNTLNRFRKSQLRETVKDVFGQVLLMLIEQGYVHLNDYYVDGTKIESVANRYSFVWAKNVQRYKSRLLDKIAGLIEQIEAANDAAETEASKQEAQREAPQISDSKALVETIERLNEQLHEQLPDKKKVARQLKKLEEEHLPKLQSYEEQEMHLDGRSSYSKTDVDATFMRTKDDHLGNGQLKPCYNVQLGTEDQFIINYTVHQTSSDMAVFVEHMDDTLEVLDGIEVPAPKRIGADAGYGSEENYEYLEQKGIDAYMKYPGFYQEQKSKYKNDPFHPSNLYYNEEQDFYVCPMGQHLTYRREEKTKSRSGFDQKISIYQAQQCCACPLRGMCHRSKGNRILQVNRNAQRLRQQAKENLTSLRGIRMRSQRGVDTEPVFGHIKQDRHFRRFMLTSKRGVATETGLLAIAHNIKKWAAKINQGGIMPTLPVNPAQSAQMEINEPKMAKMRA